MRDFKRHVQSLTMTHERFQKARAIITYVKEVVKITFSTYG